ncbi:MAG: hypothetical protein L6Q92_16205 [Phycisphaerae bacterium]|nr:hypothetical protein [Phycisphaerae bacterium]
MGTIMIKPRRSHNRRQRSRVGRHGPTRPPTVRSIVSWSLVCAIPAAFADCWLYRYAMNHLETRGHIHLPHNDVVIAFTLTGIALSVPIAGVLLRRQANRHVNRG